MKLFVFFKIIGIIKMQSQKTMKNIFVPIFCIVILAAIVFGISYNCKPGHFCSMILGIFQKQTQPQNQTQNNLTQAQEGIEFDKCVTAGNPVTESYPRQCTIDGKTYKENIGNAIEKKDLVQTTQPKPGSIITSPTTVIGQARGTWFFEGQFPVVLQDSSGHELGRGAAKAFSDWTTTNFVPFEVTFEFAIPSTQTGTLMLQKDNPSGDPSKDDQLKIPIRFVPLKTLPTK
jgi:hypothetical protein